MEYFVHETFQLMKENFEYWKLYFATAIQTPVIKLISAKLTDLVPRFLGMLMAYYQKQGSGNPRGEALLFGAMMDGIGFNYIMAPNTFPLEEMEDLVIKRFCRNNMNKQEPGNKKN
jgi:hypothetical protein